ncbi:MAG: hypothetical protein II073_09190 [Lachnospiraceae bacterium]|nr:hypothetical protein [Lachnospiraceae bacterium]
MIIWSEQLYMDEIAKRQKEKVQEHIKKGRLQFPFFLIILPTNPCNLLDIISVNDLRFSYYKKKQIKVLGMAGSRRYAKIIAAAIVAHVYEKTGDFQIAKWYGLD